jgi:hypothetical protein
VSHDISVNILEAITMFSAAWRSLNATTVANCFHKAGVVQQKAEELKSENYSDSDM